MLTVVPDGCPAREGARRMVDELLAFCDYPAGHRTHLRTASPIEPAVALVRHRTKVTKGPGPGVAGRGVLIERPEPAAA